MIILMKVWYESNDWKSFSWQIRETEVSGVEARKHYIHSIPHSEVEEAHV